MRALLVCALLSGCSLVFVEDVNPRAPGTCTTSRALPVTDLVVGALAGGAVAAVTYGMVQRINGMCVGDCYHPWKPATLAAFLVVSPWWISSAIGFSDTAACRRARL